ncbi:uncharacterized protein [Aegilops tauschii subsp. strangulata]|uniref:uncharacterized protein n=1 Tax=Aegilops tauschii subsp. strangulata TaxID=200361 RepID=UPI003CC846DF
MNLMDPMIQVSGPDPTETSKIVLLLLLSILVCFIDGGGINLFLKASKSKQKRRRYPTTLTTATPFHLDLRATSKDATGSRDQQVLHRRGEAALLSGAVSSRAEEHCNSTCYSQRLLT